MKKKLQLNKEIVSILDRNSMRQMTKAGASDRCESGLCIEYTVKLCPSDRRTALGGTHSQRDPAPPAKDFTQKYDTNRISMFVSEIPARYG